MVGTLLSTSLARGIPITEVSRWLGHRSIEVTHQAHGRPTATSWDRARMALDDAYGEITLIHSSKTQCGITTP
jgi:hypothetical protein